MNNTNQIEIEKLKIVNVPAEHQENGIVAFQMIRVTIKFFGKVMTEMLDTKIMADGRQFVIDGNGFIKAGSEI